MGKARFSGCGLYRWWLLRRWDAALPPLLFIGLNPSMADGRRDDPTLRRLVGLARGWGFGSLEVLNLYSRISASPSLLRRVDDPVGAPNDHWLRRRLALQPQAVVWAGWGAGGGLDAGRLAQLAPLLRTRRLHAVGVTASGDPRHPLYVPATAVLQRWSWRDPLALGHPGQT
ncbi:conserved hypothetical protein [Cyanobium sp. PCC 7001]|uniref:DUF1643 domain-containing protein n=1 Tax=Cyanobium sp. PCC 7001 TaxID=180281 RepID=UPI0001804AD7|nr:DUF1643 domain-containing protein [Cyanobium sp. PCC 7001]EDY38429.1 conserved hypothetical protein [Cyanobium sp. PCC 7001]